MAPEPESAALLRQAAAALSSGNADQLRHRYSPGYGSTPGPSLLPGMKPRAKPSAQVAATPGKLGKAAEALKAYLDGPPPADSARDELFAIVGDALKMSADQMAALVPYMAQGIASQPAPKRKKPPAMSSDVVRETLTALGAALQTAPRLPADPKPDDPAPDVKPPHVKPPHVKPPHVKPPHGKGSVGQGCRQEGCCEAEEIAGHDYNRAVCRTLSRLAMPMRRVDKDGYLVADCRPIEAIALIADPDTLAPE